MKSILIGVAALMIATPAMAYDSRDPDHTIIKNQGSVHYDNAGPDNPYSSYYKQREVTNTGGHVGEQRSTEAPSDCYNDFSLELADLYASWNDEAFAQGRNEIMEDRYGPGWRAFMAQESGC